MKRFQHYLDTAMTDAEIECEIGQIELTNLLTALRENPEESLLRHEAEQEAAGSVDKFLSNLQGNVRNKMKQYNRMLGVLWHCYLSADHATQLEVAATLAVS